MTSRRQRMDCEIAFKNDGDLSLGMMSLPSEREVTVGFNEAFKFLQTKAEKVESEDDVIDTGMKKILLELMEDQR